MSRHMNSRRRKSVSSNGRTKKQRNVKNCSTHSSTAASHLFSSPGKPMLKCGRDQTSRCILRPLLVQGLAIIMGSLVGPQEGQEGIPLVETQVVVIPIQTVGGKVEGVGTVVGRILLKAVERHMGLVACPVLHHGVEGEVGMELALQTINKTVPMAVQMPVVGQT